MKNWGPNRLKLLAIVLFVFVLMLPSVKTPQVEAQNSPEVSQLLVFFRNVLLIDTSHCTVSGGGFSGPGYDNSPELGTRGISHGKVTLTFDTGGSVDSLFEFRGKYLVWCLVYYDVGNTNPIPYVSHTSEDPLEMARSFLERYQTFVNDPTVARMRSLLNNVTTIESMSKIDGNLKLEIVVREGKPDFDWSYSFEGEDYKLLSISFLSPPHIFTFGYQGYRYNMNESVNPPYEPMDFSVSPAFDSSSLLKQSINENANSSIFQSTGFGALWLSSVSIAITGVALFVLAKKKWKPSFFNFQNSQSLRRSMRRRCKSITLRKNRVICTLMLVILVSFGISSWNIDMANANFMYPPLERIYIKADGSVSPQANSFRVTGDVYTLVANITNYGLEIQRDNIVVDGSGFVLQKNMPAMGRQEAVGLNGIRNVTVKNFDIRGYGYGVYLSNAHDCSIIDNTFSSNKYGIALTDKSAFNFVSNNSWLSGGGIFITNSPNNVLKSNSIDGAGPNFWIDCENVTSTSDFVNDVDESNTIKGKPVYYWVNRQDQVVPSNAGFVALISCTSITVENLNLTNNGQGVLLVETRSSKLAANNLTGNNKGIALYNSQNNQVTGNNFTNNTYGIICRSRPNTFKENKLQNNTYDANFEDRFFDEFDRSNIVDGKPICYWLWQTNKVVPTDSGYVVLLSCKNVTVQNLNITNRRQGMYLDGLENSLITRNIVTNNVAGIILKGSTNNKIKGNLITNNSDGIYVEASSLNEFSANKIAFSVNFGIRFEDDSANMVNFNYISHGKVGFTMNRGSNNVISGNTVIYTQEKGMHIGESVNNKVTGNNVAWSKGYALTISGNVGNNSIYYNDFVNNAMSAQAQAYPGANTQNIWDDGQRGNFWSDYEQRYPTAKQRTASTWDTSVTMNANNIDRYPLTQPVNMKYQVTILQPANTSYNTNALPFFISVTGPVSWIAYSIDNKANVTTKTDAMLNDLLLGSHKLTVYAGHEKGRCASETIYFETTQNSTSTSQPTSNPAFATPQGTEQPSTTISPSATLQPTPSEKGSLPTAVPASRGILDESKAVLPIAVGIIVLIAGGSTVLLKKSKKSQPK